MSQKIKILFLITLTLFSIIGKAELIYDDFDKETDLKEEMIQKNIEISNWFDGMADSIDLFLVGERLTKRKNDTSFKIENITYWDEGEKVKNLSSFNLNLRLPNFEEFWQLKLSSYDVTKEKSSAQRTEVQRVQRKNNYGASVGVFRNLGKIRFTYQPRIGLQDPLNVSHSFMFENITLFKYFELNPKFQLFTNPDDGAGFFFATDLFFRLSKTWGLTFINDAEYLDKIRELTVNHGLSFSHYIADTMSMSYDLVYTFNNRPQYNLEQYVASVTWKQLIYKKILDYRITPHVDFLREEGFRKKVGLIFNIGLTF